MMMKFRENPQETFLMSASPEHLFPPSVNQHVVSISDMSRMSTNMNYLRPAVSLVIVLI